MLVRDRFLLFFDRLFWAEDIVGVGEHEVEPNIFLNLLDDMSEALGDDAFYRIVVLGEWLEEGHYTFTDSRLLPPLVDISLVRIEE